MTAPSLPLGIPSYRVLSDSCSLLHRMRLYYAGLASLLGPDSPFRAMHPDVNLQARRVYTSAHLSPPFTGIHADVIDFNDALTTEHPLSPETVRYHQNIAGIISTPTGWRIRVGPHTRSGYCILPQGDECFIIPRRTTAGWEFYDRRWGTPLDTCPDRAQAVRAWAYAGVPPAFLESELPIFTRSGIGDGIVCVQSGWSTTGYPVVRLCGSPGSRLTCIYDGVYTTHNADGCDPIRLPQLLSQRRRSVSPSPQR